MMSKTLKATITVAVTLSICLLSTTSWARMSPPVYTPLPTCEQDPTDEAHFPDPLVLELDALRRGVEDRTSKSGMAMMTLLIDGYDAALVDGANPPDFEGVENATLGLRFDVEGEAPEGLRFPDQPVVLLDPHDRILLHWWNDIAPHDTIDLTLTATWVDCYGRTGPTSEPIHIGGKSDIGDKSDSFIECSTADTEGTTSDIFSAVFLLVCLRE